jgi:hypothetical protein
MMHAGTWCEDYSQLRHLRSLAQLNLDLSAFTQLEVIEALPHLRSLSVARCPIARAKWPYLALARNLRELNVAHTSFTDCTVLASNGATAEMVDAPSSGDQMPTMQIIVTEAYDVEDDDDDSGDEEGEDHDVPGRQPNITQEETRPASASRRARTREGLTRLERLDLDGCYIQERGMRGLAALPSLKYLSIRQVTSFASAVMAMAAANHTHAHAYATLTCVATPAHTQHERDGQVPSMGDLSPLASCGGLRYLYLDQDQVPSHMLHNLHSLLPQLTIHASPSYHSPSSSSSTASSS